jgi:hypothetical protein
MKLDELINQATNVLAKGRDHSAKNETEAALRCYSVARQLRLDADTNLLAVIDEWKRDTFHFTERLNNIVNPPGLEELLHLHRRMLSPP